MMRAERAEPVAAVVCPPDPKRAPIRIRPRIPDMSDARFMGGGARGVKPGQRRLTGHFGGFQGETRRIYSCHVDAVSHPRDRA